MKFGGPLKVPHMRGNGAQSIIDALLLANPKWAGCAKSCVIQHANDRWAGKSPAKIADRGKGNRALTDEVMYPTPTAPRHTRHSKTVSRSLLSPELVVYRAGREGVSRSSP